VVHAQRQRSEGGSGSGSGSESESENEPVKWRTEGHEWIGQTVLVFNEDSGIEGSQLADVQSWVDVSGSDQALWHIVHRDNDEEYLDYKEMQEGLEARRLALANKPEIDVSKLATPSCIS